MTSNVRCVGQQVQFAGGWMTLRPCGWVGQRMTDRHGHVINIGLPCRNCGGRVQEIPKEQRNG